MSKRERLFFTLWGLTLFPLLIVFVTVKYSLGSPVILALLTYMGGVKYILAKDAADNSGP